MKNIALLFVFLAAGLAVGCGDAGQSQNQNGVGNGVSNIAKEDLPPGLSGEPIKPTGESTPGIPPEGEANKVPVGATPTPGIPDEANIGKPLPRGATPTPGIPSEEEQKRQREQKLPENVRPGKTRAEAPPKPKRP
ncbi:MAG: hypothetical protein KF855_14545 [Acidobacteria bacterium]|nr:hypothetical protein [Acidobacteriota bacterium]